MSETREALRFYACTETSCECPAGEERKDDLTCGWRAAQALRALSDERGEERGWMPIETAPRNGDSILLYSEGWSETLGEIQVGYWISGQWAFGEVAIDPEDDEMEPPTHWQPLPAPPASIRAGGGNG